MDYLKYCIGKNLTIRDAMKLLDDLEPKILFIVEDKKLIASLTDGDIRRFLLNEGTLSSAVIDAANKHPRCASNLTDARELYNKKDFIAIPVVDKQGNLLDIFLGSNCKKHLVDLGVPVVINAGGKGTRLEPYTKILPKPLIPIGEKPIIEHIMARFKEYGCKQFHIIVNYKKELIKAFFADNEEHYDISWYNEEKPLGTGGGLYYLKGKINSTFFFTNCDNLLVSNYESMLRFHRENHNSITMVCAYKNIKIPYGVIDMGANGSIKSMQEKPEFSFLTNTGIYIVEPSILEGIEEEKPLGFPDIIAAAQQRGEKVAVYPISEKEWMDMGQFDELEKMRQRLSGELA